MSTALEIVFFASFGFLSLARGVVRIRNPDSWWERQHLMNGDGPSLYAKRQLKNKRLPPSRGAVLILVGFDLVVGFGILAVVAAVYV